MKKYLLSLTTLALLLCEASFTGGGMAFAFDNGNYTYTIISSSAPRTVSIAAKSGATFSGSISLPSSVSYNSNSYSVVAITASGFSGKTAITSITIPNTVTTINNSAFSGCTGITSVTFTGTSKVATIGDNAFDGCSKLKTCTLPLSLTTIGSYAFRGCAFTSVTIPKNVTQMKTGVYLGCTSLTSVTWNAINCANYAKSGSGPYSFSSPFYYKTTTNVVTTVANQINKITFGSEVEHIPAYLCYYMTNLTEVTIPASVTSLGSSEDRGFGGCSNIQKVIWNATNCTSASSPFSGSASKLTSFEFASNVQNIPASLCSGYTHLTKIVLPATVTNIAASAFSGCTALDTIVSFNSTHPAVANANAFNNVPVGCNVVVPNVSEYSGQTGWNHFTSLSTTISGNCGKTTPTEVTWEMNLSNGRLTISGTGTGAMANYITSNTAPWYAYKSAITNVIIEEGVVEIGNYAFYSLNAMTSITIPTSITKIGEAAFSGCSTTLFTDVIYLGDASRWANITFSGTTAATVNPINYTKSLKNSAGEIMRNITISNSVKNYAFYMNEALESVNFAESGVTNIGESAFYGCNKLTSITIPSSLTSIQKNAFSACSLISSVVWNATHCGDFSWTQNGPTSITTTAPFYGIRTQITSLVFGENVDKIPNYICRGLTGLTSIIIPESVETIGESSFTDCSNLTSVTWNAANCAWNNGSYSPFNSSATKISSFSLGNNVANIPQRLCKGFTLISSITIPTSVTSIGEDAFSGCSNLKYITWNAANCGDFSSSTAPFDPIKTQIRTFTFGANVGSIPNYLCYGMNSSYLTSITVPASVSNIGSYAFKNCSSLSSLNFGAITSLTIGGNAFDGCSSLTTVTLPEGLTTIGQDAFVNCTSLATITIPRSVTSVATSSSHYTFNGCTALRTVNWNAEACANFNKASNDGKTFTYYTPFGDTKASITSFNFGANVRVIPSCLCEGMTSLTSVSLPASVQQINQDVFHGCTGLTSITIPANVTSMGGTVFENCSNLASVTSQRATPPTLGTDVFKGISASKKLYVHHSVSAKAAYRSASGWSSFGEANTFPKIVQFDLNGQTGDAIDPQFFDNITSKASAPSDPADVNYHSFSGWYENPEGTGSEFAFSTTNITEDKTLYAKWTIYNYQVSFDLQGHGSSIAAQTIDHNGLVSKPDDPSADYYTFGGWYKEAGCSNAWDFSEDHVTEATTLYAKWSLADLTLNDNANNASVLELYNGESTNVNLMRSLISASYNTICLPFAMTAAQVESAFGAECDIEELTKASCADGNLKLFFTKRTAIEAGKPYLIQPQSDVANPVISGVTIDNTSRPSEFEGVTFTGIFSPTALADSENLLFLGASNTLYMSSGGQMKGLRAYFELTTPAASAAARRSARIILHEEVATGIEETITNDQSPITNKIIRDGQLFILRDGKTYNAQGALIK